MCQLPGTNRITASPIDWGRVCSEDENEREGKGDLKKGFEVPGFTDLDTKHS